eukprot:CAMPEP_0179181712 /NCGR_PEP_ID=MMETSP0796-20121207/90008_1 /TAXON_ID=73915 /ORGANISM="Pyrodinium bahamense, Strain pbaha01" /LENGTH=345 /DNA_ID=CAMNT_0020885505 /DNA_START=11 /DNA_END=1044 /DNA_ORIENTATION=+
MAETLLLQMGPTLERLAPLAWHRDVNSHNMLVSDAVDGAALPLLDSGCRASFWLCDLGLAVDSSNWVSEHFGENGPCGEAGGAWRVTDIGGGLPLLACELVDGAHCYGAEYLEGHEDFCRQYQTRLDIHGLAITGVEVLCSTALAARDAGAPPGEDDCACWSELLDSWQRYREAVTHWWEAIYSVFSVGGDFRPVHAWLVDEGVAEQVIDLTTALRAALLACAESEERSRGSKASNCMLRILAELMDEASKMQLGEACARLAGSGSNQADAELLVAAASKGAQVLDSLKAIPAIAAGSSMQACPEGLLQGLWLETEEVAKLREAQAHLRQDVERLRTAKIRMQHA